MNVNGTPTVRSQDSVSRSHTIVDSLSTNKKPYKLALIHTDVDVRDEIVNRLLQILLRLKRFAVVFGST